jgi:nitrogen-specific signal transduction histidine kinase
LIKKIKLDIQLDNQLPLIEGDSNQIQQLIINLLTNASEAIGSNNGNICLKTGIKQCDKPFIDNCCLHLITHRVITFL